MTYNTEIDATIAILRKGWTKRRYAVDRQGEKVPLGDPEVCRFCVNGAFLKACGEVKMSRRRCELEAFLREKFTHYTGQASVSYNDDAVTTVDDVIEVLETIKRET